MTITKHVIKKTHIIELNSIILLFPNVQMLNIVLKQVEEA